MERIGAGFVAILAAAAYATFDIVASLLVLLGFLIIRWAVVAAPALGTVGLLRPASSGLRRLVNAVIAAAINIAIFGTGAAVYLFAVDLIMSTASLPGWLQVTLVLLCGVVGWMLLRPYTRITQLSGRSSGATLLTARPAAVTTTAATTTVDVSHDGQRNEGRLELEVKEELKTVLQRAEASPAADGTRQRGWTTTDVPETESGFAIYRPTSVPHQAAPPTVGGGGSAQPQQPARTEARAESR
jgi:membrane protein implicated in regulation of membrane protease activity